MSTNVLVPSSDQNEVLMRELLDMLLDNHPSVRSGALSQVASLSASIEGRAALSKTDIVRILVRIIGDENHSNVKDSMTAMINLAEVSSLATQMVERNVVSRILDLIISGNGNLDSAIMPLYIMLLSNVTRFPIGARKLLNLDDPESLHGYYMAKLLPLFLQTPETLDSLSEPVKDKTSWIGPILVNATTIKEGRTWFTDKENRRLKLVVSQIASKSVLRRRGALGIIRNCMFDHADHQWILNDPDMDLLTNLLLPIRGNEVFDEDDKKGMPERLHFAPVTNQMEPDIECRKLIVDTLTLFTATKFGRDYLKDHKVYPIIKALDRVEENEQLNEKIYDLVHVLVLDDPEQKSSMEDLAPVASSNSELPQETSSQSSIQDGNTSIDEKPALPPTPKPAPDIDEYGNEIEEI